MRLMKTMKLLHLEEPSLRFGLGQSVDDPRDGLTLFGPLDSGETTAIKVGAVGTPEGIERFERDHNLPVTGQNSPRLRHALSVATGRPLD